MFKPLTDSDLRQVMYWLKKNESEYQSWSVGDLFINAYLEYHRYFRTYEKSPTWEEAQAQIQIDGNSLLQLGLVPRYVGWFIRRHIYPLFVIHGDGPVETSPLWIEEFGFIPSPTATDIKVE